MVSGTLRGITDLCTHLQLRHLILQLLRLSVVIVLVIDLIAVINQIFDPKPGHIRVIFTRFTTAQHMFCFDGQLLACDCAVVRHRPHVTLRAIGHCLDAGH